MLFWTREETLDLIDKVRESNVWDQTLSENRNPLKAHEKMRRIAEDIGINVADVEIRWRSIRTRLKHELKKIEKSRKHVGKGKQLYTPSWFAFDSLRFIWDEKERRRNQPGSRSNQQERNSSSETDDSTDSDEDHATNEDNGNTRNDVDSDSSSESTSSGSTSDGSENASDRALRYVPTFTTKDKDSFVTFGETVTRGLRYLQQPQYSHILYRVQGRIISAMVEGLVCKEWVDRHENAPDDDN